ncbi:uncharacterized protein [Zea mays]|uniref:uncharacterized protein n=1 Tax=Zea mays TaxID=4577 RepID=UPI00165278F8|nr:uncharacterized protein LOC118473526 [Zea mays]
MKLGRAIIIDNFCRTVDSRRAVPRPINGTARPICGVSRGRPICCEGCCEWGGHLGPGRVLVAVARRPDRGRVLTAGEWSSSSAQPLSAQPLGQPLSPTLASSLPTTSTSLALDDVAIWCRVRVRSCLFHPKSARSPPRQQRASCPASGAGGPRLLPPSIGARNSAAATPVLPNVYSALLCFDRLSELSSAIDEFSSGYQQDCARAGERGRLKSHRGNSNTIVALAGNKADVLDTRQVSADVC